MHWSLRILLFWLVIAIGFYMWGIPALTRVLTNKARTQNAQACHDQLAAQHLVPQPVSEEHAGQYCDCLNDALQFERDDLFEMARTHQLPERLQTALQAQVDQCTPMLQSFMRPPQAGDAVKQPDGSVEIHL